MNDRLRDIPVTAVHGPEMQWEAELQGISKAGLVWFAKELSRLMRYPWFASIPAPEMLAWVRSAKKVGRSQNAMRNLDRMEEDFDSWLRTRMRQRRASKKAARARKKARR